MIKQKIFEAMDMMYQTQIITTLSYQFLLFIEFLQMLYYSVYQTYLFKTNYFVYFVEAISYFQPVKYLTTIDSTLFSVFVIFGFIYLSVSVTLFIYVLITEKSMFTIYSIRIYMVILITFIQEYQFNNCTFIMISSQNLKKYIILNCNLLMVMLVTVFVIPFLSIFLATFKCEGQMECDSILYYIMVILSSLGIVMLSICLVFFEIFLVDYNPFTPIPYASKYTKLNWIELIFKIYLPFFAVMDPQQDAEKPFITILCIMYAMMITMRLKTRQFIENSVNISKLSQTSLLFWTSFVSVCHAYLDQGEIDDMGFFYEVVCSPLVVYCCFKLNKSPELITHMKKDIQLEETVQEMIFLIENREKPINRMKLEGFIVQNLLNNVHVLQYCQNQYNNYFQLKL